jgi:hypothetical protein
VILIALSEPIATRAASRQRNPPAGLVLPAKAGIQKRRRAWNDQAFSSALRGADEVAAATPSHYSLQVGWRGAAYFQGRTRAKINIDDAGG